VSKPWRETPKQKYRARDPKLTSKMMSSVKNRDSKAEILLRKELWHRGWRYRLHCKEIVGTPDLVFREKKTLVFIDGDFWHGRALIEEGVAGLQRGIRTSRSDWWIKKISRTVERDREVTEKLKGEGWTVLRFWESVILNNVSSVANTIIFRLRSHNETLQDSRFRP
jgi:DNA mismatch endonuclease (patch repair protein)